MVSPNQQPSQQPAQLIWWIDTTGTLHACASASTPPPWAQLAGIYAQGLVNPTAHTGAITHIHNKPATHAAIPRELFDVLESRFPQTRWWIFDHTPSTPIPIHS